MLSYCIQIALPLMSFSALSHALPNGGGSPGSPWGAGSPTTTYPAPTWTSCPQGQKAVNNITNANVRLCPSDKSGPTAANANASSTTSKHRIRTSPSTSSLHRTTASISKVLTIQPSTVPSTKEPASPFSPASPPTRGWTMPSLVRSLKQHRVIPPSPSTSLRATRLPSILKDSSTHFRPRRMTDLSEFLWRVSWFLLGTCLPHTLLIVNLWLTSARFRGSDNTATISNQICSRQFIYQPTTVTGLQNMADSGDISGLCPGGVSFYQLTFKEYDEEALSAVLDLLIDSLIIDKWQCVAE